MDVLLLLSVQELCILYLTTWQVQVLSKLRLLMISKMAKPEEVIVVEDENGNIVRETMKDTDVLARYKTMHETLVYLSHLDHEDTENQMLEKLRLQVHKDNARLTLDFCVCDLQGHKASVHLRFQAVRRCMYKL